MSLAFSQTSEGHEQKEKKNSRKHKWKILPKRAQTRSRRNILKQKDLDGSF
jgi:hypothetical protein